MNLYISKIPKREEINTNFLINIFTNKGDRRGISYKGPLAKNNMNFNSKNNKKVEFNKNVTVINIQSYKKEMRKDYYQDINKDYLDEDISAHNRIKCFECNIF